MEEESHQTEDDSTKKIIIIVLLAISSIISIYLLNNLPDKKVEYLTSLGQADSLIKQEFDDFNIGKKQIQTHSIKVNKKFSRKIYDVSLPPGFSKTYLHAELARLMYPYGIRCPAQVFFPQKNMNIEVYYDGTVIRTIKLRTDTTLKMHRSPGTILAYFNNKPSLELIKKFKSLGETLPFVFHVSKATEGRDWLDELKMPKRSVIFWIQKDFEYYNTDDRSDWYLNRQLKILDKIETNPIILIAPSLNEQTKNMIEKDGEVLGLSVVRPGHIILDKNTYDQLHFNQEIKKFSKFASEGKRPILLLKASQNTFSWLINKLPELKKGGLVLVPPIIDHY